MTTGSTLPVTRKVTTTNPPAMSNTSLAEEASGTKPPVSSHFIHPSVYQQTGTPEARLVSQTCKTLTYRVSDRHGIINESTTTARGPPADEVLSQHLLPFTCTSTSNSQVLPASCPLNKTIKVRSSSNLAEGPMAAIWGSVFNRDPLILNPLVCARHQGTPFV